MCNTSINIWRLSTQISFLNYLCTIYTIDMTKKQESIKTSRLFLNPLRTTLFLLSGIILYAYMLPLNLLKKISVLRVLAWKRPQILTFFKKVKTKIFIFNIFQKKECRSGWSWPGPWRKTGSGFGLILYIYTCPSETKRFFLGQEWSGMGRLTLSRPRFFGTARTFDSSENW